MIQDDKNKQQNLNYVYELKLKEVLFDGQLSKFIILRDISEVSKIEYARSIEKITEIMIASTSHDMRTPLNTIVNMHRMIGYKLKDP